MAGYIYTICLQSEHTMTCILVANYTIPFMVTEHELKVTDTVHPHFINNGIDNVFA